MFELKNNYFLKPTSLLQTLFNCIQPSLMALFCCFSDNLMLGFNILKYTSKSDRFTMGIMFLSTNDLSKVRRVVEELASKLKDFQMKVSSKDILELRKAYKAT